MYFISGSLLEKFGSGITNSINSSLKLVLILVHSLQLFDLLIVAAILVSNGNIEICLLLSYNLLLGKLLDSLETFMCMVNDLCFSFWKFALLKLHSFL